MKGKKMKAIESHKLVSMDDVERMTAEKCRDFVCQTLAIVMMTLKVDYNHRDGWIRCFLNNFFRNTEFINDGMGRGKRLDAEDVLKFWWDNGIDILQYYDESGLGYMPREKKRMLQRGEEGNNDRIQT